MRARAAERPFRLIDPRSLSTIVLTCEHASNPLPFPRRVGLPQRAVLETHWGWDLGAWALTRYLAARLGAGAIGGRWSRLYIDLNRGVDDPTLIRREAGGVALPWNSRLTATQVERRVLDFHAPYHSAVDRLVSRRLVHGVRPLLFSVHTFTPELDGRRRPFDIGVLFDRHGDLARRLGDGLRGAGCSVRYNQPHSGRAGMMYAADRHGRHHRLPCLELEVNQALLDRRSAVSKLGAILARELARAQASP